MVLNCVSNSCNEAIEVNWLFCPNCGTNTNGLENVPDEVISTSVDGSERISIKTRNPVRSLAVAIESCDSRIEIVSHPYWSNGEIGFEISAKNLLANSSATLVLRSPDSVRKDRWTLENDRLISISIRRTEGQFVPKLYPELLYFTDHNDLRDLTLVNEGDATQDVFVHPSSGYRIAQHDIQTPIRLESRKSVKLKVQRVSGSSSDGQIHLLNKAGEPIGKAIKIVRRTSRRNRILPALVIAIDFGTSNTSVFALKPGQEGNLRPTPIPIKGQSRIETSVELVSGSKWEFFGPRNTDAMGVVRDLKTLSRENGVVQLFGRTFTAQEILVKLLDDLFRNYIEPYIDGRISSHDLAEGAHIEFVFTVPVRDGVGTLNYEAYVETLTDAATRAGILDEERHFTVITRPEPDAAAVEVALNAHKKGRSIKEGDRMLVIDLGGGTSDITSCIINLESGKVSLSDFINCPTSFGAVEFGGNFVDYQMGKWFLYQGSDSDDVINSIQDLRSKFQLISLDFAREATDFAENFDSDDATISKTFDALSGDDGNPIREPMSIDPECWLYRFKHLAEPIKSSKITLSNNLDQESVSFPGHGDSNRNYDLYRRTLDGPVSQAMDRIVGLLEDFMKANDFGPRDVQHVALVGGSSRLNMVKQSLLKLFDKARFIEIDNNEVDLAVCMGATQHYETEVDVLPVSVCEQIDDLVHTLARQGAAMPKARPFRKNLQVQGTTTAYKLFLSDGGAEYQIFAKNISQIGRWEIEVNVSSKNVYLTLTCDGNVMENFLYEF